MLLCDRGMVEIQSTAAAEIRDKVKVLIQDLLSAYRLAISPFPERDALLELKAISTTLALTEPLNQLGDFPELGMLEVLPGELAGVLASYRQNYRLPTARYYLGKAQNCMLRMQILDPANGAVRFTAMLNAIQANEGIKLAL